MEQFLWNNSMEQFLWNNSYPNIFQFSHMIFVKGFSAQHCLLGILENQKRSVDQGNITKLNAYEFSYQALKLISNYHTKRKQRIKINNSYSFWEDIICGVPEGSIMNPICLIFLLIVKFLWVFFQNFNPIFEQCEKRLSFYLSYFMDIVQIIRKQGS